LPPSSSANVCCGPVESARTCRKRTNRALRCVTHYSVDRHKQAYYYYYCYRPSVSEGDTFVMSLSWSTNRALRCVTLFSRPA
jgi:hypothetical protein